MSVNKQEVNDVTHVSVASSLVMWGELLQYNLRYHPKVRLFPPGNW